jgi:uncharacterized protein (TIGR00730 family)
MRSLCVFCGSKSGSRPEYTAAARALGGLLAQRGIELVYGGGNVGLMGSIADAVLAGGGRVTGVIPQSLVDKEVAHHGVTDLRIVQTMHERKALMNDLSDGFVALPGGFGTLDEFFEVLTWAQLGFHTKPCALLNVAGYFDPLLAALDHMAAERFLKPAHRQMVLAATDPVDLLERLAEFSTGAATKTPGGNFL